MQKHRLVAVVSSRYESVPHGRLVARLNRAGLSYSRLSSGRRQLCTLSSAQPLVSYIGHALLERTYSTYSIFEKIHTLSDDSW